MLRKVQLRRVAHALGQPPAPDQSLIAQGGSDWLVEQDGTDNLAQNVYAAPVITAGQSFSKAEHLAAGQSVGTVAKTGGPGTWSITAGNGSGALAINSSTGEITTAAALDYETTASYSLTIQCSGPGGSDSETVTVNVTNITEPTVNASQTFTVNASDPDGTVLGTVATTGATPTGFAIGGTGLAISAAGQVTKSGAPSTGNYGVTCSLPGYTSPSVNIGVTVSSSSLLLDTLDAGTQVMGAYAPYKLRTAYAGSCIRVRRSSDNAEQDIGFDGSGNLDESALTTFVGSNTGSIARIYDQSGTGGYLVYVSGTRAEITNSSGVIHKINSVPVFKHVAAGSYYEQTGVTIPSAAKCAIIMFARGVSLADNQRFAGIYSGSGADWNAIEHFMMARASGNLDCYRGSTSYSAGALANATSYALAMVFDGAQGRAFVNGTGGTAVNQTNNFTTPTAIRLGAAGGAAGEIFDGYTGPFFVLSNIATGDRAALESHIQTKYGF